jgi:PKD domain
MRGHGGRAGLAVLVVTAALLVLPSVASAAVLCVGTSGGACTQSEPNYATAMAAAHSGDTIQFGPGVYPVSGSAYTTTDVTLRGAGPGGSTGTTFTAASGDGTDVELAGSGDAASGFEVEIPSGASGVTGLEVDGSASDIAVVASAGASSVTGVVTMPGYSFSGTIDLSAASGQTYGVVSYGGSVTDATIIDPYIGIFAQAATTTATATRVLDASYAAALATDGATLTVDDSLLTLATPCAANCVALFVSNTNSTSGEVSTLNATQDTLVAGATAGGQPAGTPVYEGTVANDTTVANVDSTVASGFLPDNGGAGYGLTCYTASGTADMSVFYSSFNFDDTLSGDDSLGNCASYTHNHNENQGGASPIAPVFVNAAGGDYHLPYDSPLVDAGDPALSGGSDLDGNPRVVDGNGDGSAISDIGAFEYQRGAPTARISAPTTATTGVAASFNGGGSSDPNDGEALSYAWSFDDGTSASGAVVSHTFATAGSHHATLTVTEPNGVTASATAAIVVSLPAPVIGGLKLSHTHFKRGKKAASVSRAKPVGTSISFTLSEAATVTLSFDRLERGRIKAGACVAPTHALRHAAHCTRSLLDGSLSFSLPAGASTIAFDGVLDAGAKLRPGLYKLTLGAQASSGPPSAPVSTKFTLKR